MTYKAIIKGRLEFGNPRSFDKVYKMYEHRVENYYKSDIIIKEIETVFDESSFCLSIPRHINPAVSTKTWKNTASLLEYVAQFAVAGSLRIWMIDNGVVKRKAVIEPKSDKMAVQAYLRGRDLVNEKGKETEAMESLSKAIFKFERHAPALERRGHVNFRLKNYKDALKDFSQSIECDPNIPEPHLGKANVEIIQNNLDGAITELEMAIKKSIPLQSIYWKARRLKAECHMQQGDFAKATVDLKFFTKRRFDESNPNFMWRKKAFFDYGKALLEVGDYIEALKAFNAASEIEEGHDPTPQADELLYRGIARKHAGQKGFEKDLKEAANLGSEKAAKLLEEVV